MLPGEVVWVRFPFSSGETVAYKRRPVVVVNVTGAGPEQVVLVAMVTSNARRVAHPGLYDVLLENWLEIGLTSASVVRINRLWSAENRDITGSLGKSVSPVVLAQIRKGISALVG